MSDFFGALLYYCLLKPISLLPLPILYIKSRGYYFWLYKVFGYRKEVVMKNIRNSFPEKSEKEIKQVTRQFYKHFCDIIVEGIKSFSISERTLQKHVEPVNTELLEKYFHQNRSVILCTGHYANWEWPAIAFIRHSSHKALGIYLPLKNKFFDRKLQETRSKFGLTLMS